MSLQFDSVQPPFESTTSKQIHRTEETQKEPRRLDRLAAYVTDYMFS